MTENDSYSKIAQRFRGYLPVIIDVETGGFNHEKDALLEIAAVYLRMNNEGLLEIDSHHYFNVHPFEGANLDPASLKFTGIDPHDPLRKAVDEAKALTEIFQSIRRAIKSNDCSRAVLVGHNAAFDLAFVNAATDRCKIKRSPFHPFTAFDTASLAGLVYGQTVLSTACEAAGIPFDKANAHNALYDGSVTAELFCIMVNRWKTLGGLD
ncbi:MAG: ribonuclease T [Gammaproteobacteria bacterium]|nr:ribonuclease T [Gammaproteobacteria bacterium]